MSPELDIKPILNSLHLPKYLEAIQQAWEEEQKKRHAFWKEIDESVKAEFINGIGVYDSPVYGRHWQASSNILTELLPHVKHNALGRVGVEKVMIRCTRNDYEPDICFWRKEIADTFEETQSAFPPPNFIIEILSKSTEERDRGIKFQDYALHGVEEYWLVDVANNCIEQYYLKGNEFQLHIKASSGELVAKTIQGFKLNILDVFR
ncbi:MAG: Uma2 family endonuclease [Flammeovirgaceae bacterium]